MAWVLVVILTLALVAVSYLLVRASKRLLEFDELMQVIVSPMEKYGAALHKISTAEGLLHDHPEVVAFHRANLEMMTEIDRAISAVKSARPPQVEEPKGNRPEFE